MTNTQLVIQKDLKEIEVVTETGQKVIRKLKKNQGYSFTKFDPEKEKVVTEIPFDIRYYYWEAGGATRNSGTGTIVCGTKGEKLKPACIKKGKKTINKRHAIFHVWENEPIMVITSSQHNGIHSVKIFQYLNGQRERLSRFKFENQNYGDGIIFGQDVGIILPNHYQLLLSPIVAAIQKAETRNCQEPFYLDY